MNRGLKLLERLILSAAVVICMAGYTGAAHGRTSQSMHHSRAMISSVQQSLKSSGFYKGSIDGISGPETHSALRRFQQDHKLRVTGRLDRETLSALGIASSGQAARSSSESENNMQRGQPVQSNMPSGQQPKLSETTIKAAQTQLQKKGFYSGAINGTMGDLTEQAIRKYQQANNLTVNGQLDQATLSSLGVQ